MNHFTESNGLLDDPPALRKRLRDDGYLFLRDILPKDNVLDKDWRDTPTARYWERLPHLKTRPRENFGKG